MSTALSEEAKEARRAYYREWNANNLEKKRAYARKYYHSHKEQAKKNSASFWERKAQAQQGK